MKFVWNECFSLEAEADATPLACPLEGATGALELEDECIHGLQLMILTDFSEPKQAQRSGLVALAYWFITTKDWPQTNPYQYAVCSYARHVLTYLAIKSMVLWQVHAHVWGPSCDTASAFTWGLLHIFLNLFEQLYIDDCVKNRHPMWSCI